jgi:hypothetical protein
LTAVSQHLCKPSQSTLSHVSNRVTHRTLSSTGQAENTLAA